LFSFFFYFKEKRKKKKRKKKKEKEKEKKKLREFSNKLIPSFQNSMFPRLPLPPWLRYMRLILRMEGKLP